MRDATNIEALERVWHLALSRAEDKHAELEPGDRDGLADVDADARALEEVELFIESIGGKV